ncbi:Uncharacterized protein dnm_031670 [Desulfonema magnum]|uniref:Uncharacterized protein n=1 Tax=Desulfonema magnum TaxID=45655 RepID=A0A975BK28_9BACT|nr:Uncharacterized protein dnm_031670 [Desulfonema magnum]
MPLYRIYLISLMKSSDICRLGRIFRFHSCIEIQPGCFAS